MTALRLPPNDPREWLNRAHGNLVLSRAQMPGTFLEDLCFEAQQAAEKAIKAVFVHRGEAFRWTHDLEALLRSLANNGLKIPKYVAAASRLTRYAAAGRYPGQLKPVGLREYRRAVRIATAVLDWAERQILGPKKTPKRKK
jgi:HEPN domain-containing protein